MMHFWRIMVIKSWLHNSAIITTPSSSSTPTKSILHFSPFWPPPLSSFQRLCSSCFAAIEVSGQCDHIWQISPLWPKIKKALAILKGCIEYLPIFNPALANFLLIWQIFSVLNEEVKWSSGHTVSGDIILYSFSAPTLKRKKLDWYPPESNTKKHIVKLEWKATKYEIPLKKCQNEHCSWSVDIGIRAIQ